MLKRLIGVITVKDGWAVQSFGYKRYLPLGRPEVIAENYDRWKLDEILVVDIDRSRLELGPNFDLLQRITAKRLSTPLCYMGGVRGTADALQLISTGADRIALDSLFRQNPAAAHEISEVVGRQAVIRVQPMVKVGNNICGYDHLNGGPIGNIDVQEFIDNNSCFSELMVVDVENEGTLNSFSISLIDPFKEKNLQVICFGGVTSHPQIKKLFSRVNVSAVAIGNSLNYREIPHKRLVNQTKVDFARTTSFGAETRGAREW